MRLRTGRVHLTSSRRNSGGYGLRYDIVDMVRDPPRPARQRRPGAQVPRKPGHSNPFIRWSYDKVGQPAHRNPPDRNHQRQEELETDLPLELSTAFIQNPLRRPTALTHRTSDTLALTVADVKSAFSDEGVPLKELPRDSERMPLALIPANQDQFPMFAVSVYATSRTSGALGLQVANHGFEVVRIGNVVVRYHLIRECRPTFVPRSSNSARNDSLSLLPATT